MARRVTMIVLMFSALFLAGLWGATIEMGKEFPALGIAACVFGWLVIWLGWPRND